MHQAPTYRSGEAPSPHLDACSGESSPRTVVEARRYAFAKYRACTGTVRSKPLEGARWTSISSDPVHRTTRRDTRPRTVVPELLLRVQQKLGAVVWCVCS